MKATQLLSNLGQSLWLDNITRDLLDTGTLKHYIDEFSVTGLTSNPTIFEKAIKKSPAYDAPIREGLARGKSSEELFFELALEDITRAADLFRPTYDCTNTVDGWVSLEVSPLMAYDTGSTLRAAKDLFAPGQAPKPTHKNSRNTARSASDRGSHFCRYTGQCHAALLTRAVPGSSRCFPARHRTPARRRAQPQRRIGGIGFR